ncbi:MAG: hypothetical protein EBU90_07490 [Proteobacteria bacterium]|nr:hypothetical protein [Pseudomonadota bacterium]NBP13453.1 hypothetical protein [bacterium]
MQFLEEDLDINRQRLKALEEQVCALIENNNRLAESLKDTQRYLVKLAHNQMELTKRISEWPYVVVRNSND